MRGKVAKKIRKDIYQDADYRDRKYSEEVKSNFMWNNKIYQKTTRHSDKNRKWYQNTKRIFYVLKNQPKDKKGEER